MHVWLYAPWFVAMSGGSSRISGLRWSAGTCKKEREGLRVGSRVMPFIFSSLIVHFCQPHPVTAIVEYPQEHGQPGRNNIRLCIEHCWHQPHAKPLPATISSSTRVSEPIDREMQGSEAILRLRDPDLCYWRMVVSNVFRLLMLHWTVYF